MKVTFEEAKKITAEVVENGKTIEAVKLAIDNIIFNRLDENHLLNLIFAQVVKSKEHPEGCTYDSTTFQVVMRIIGGKILINGKPDAYAWTIKKVGDKKNKASIGFHSVEGAMNFAKTLDYITDEEEKVEFTKMLLAFGNDLLLVHDQDEKRQAIIVTEEILEKFKVGVPNSYDIEWPAKGADGVELTSIHLGDALVIEECSFGTAFYVVQKEEFNLTYKLIE